MAMASRGSRTSDPETLASDDASSIGSSSDSLASFATIAARSVSLAE